VRICQTTGLIEQDRVPTLDEVAPLEAPYPSPHDFFLRRHLKDLVCVSRVPRNIDELKRRILETPASLTEGVLERAWQEMDCRIDVCLVTKEYTSSLCKLSHNFQIKCIPLYVLILIPKYMKVFTSFPKTLHFVCSNECLF